MDDELVIGRIRSTFGVSGELKVESFSGETEHFSRLKEVMVRTSASAQRYAVESVRTTHKGILLKLHGIDSPERGASLRNAEIRVPRAQAAKLADGEYYYADLNALTVTCAGTRIGTVSDIWETGARPLIGINLDSGGSVLVPFADAFFGDVNLDAREIDLVDPMVLE